jgi:hypothetical protein
VAPRQNLAIVLLGRAGVDARTPLESECGVETPLLALDARRTILEAWLEALAATGGAWRVLLAHGVDEQRASYGRVVAPAGVSVEVRCDPSPHRGPAGVVRDLWAEACGAEPGAFPQVLVIEGSNPGVLSAEVLGRLVEPFGDSRDAGRGEIRLAVSVESAPGGVIALDRGALRRIAPVGFVDLKEQTVSALIADGGVARAVPSGLPILHARDRIGYLAAVAAALSAGGTAIAESARVGDGARIRGASILSDGVSVDDRALVVDAVLLPGARVGRGAVVARSVVAAGAVVPDAALIVDDVFAGLGLRVSAIGGIQ